MKHLKKECLLIVTLGTLGLASSCATSSTSGTRAPAMARQKTDPTENNGPTPPLSGYHLVWQDSFDGSTLDPKKWAPLVRVRDDAQDSKDPIIINNELSIKTFTDNGTNFTGFLSTHGLFDTTFGYFEAKIRFHDSPGEWCSFWLQSPTNGNPIGDPENAGMEIDIAEHRVTNASGTDLTNSPAIGALHWDGYGQFLKNMNSVTATPASGGSTQGNYHTYGVLWTTDEYDFFLDGIKVLSHPSNSNPISKRSEFIYLSCEVRNKSWAGNIPNDGYGNLDQSITGMDVQWVRVWQADK